MRLKIFQKVASVTLALFLACGCFAVSGSSSLPILTANAEDNESGFRYISNSSNKTAIITGYSGVPIKLTIPASIGGYKVTSIQADAFKGVVTLTSVSIPDSVTTIGSECFSGCTLLSTVTLGSGLSSIGSKAFENCKALTSISLPASVSSIGSEAFVGCTALSKFDVASGNLVYTSKDGILYNKSGTTLIQYPAFRAGTSYIVQDGVTKIENYAFSGNKILTSVSIASSVTSLGKGVFKDCTALTEVMVPTNLTKIEDDLFNGCKKLSRLNLPKTVTTIGASAFANCTSIPALTIPDSITIIGAEAFSGCTGLGNVTIGAKVTAVSGSAFRGCTALKEFTVADGANFTAINGVLFNKDGSRLIAYPAGSTKDAYTVGEKVTAIGAYAFDHCTNLKKLIIPANVKTLVLPVISACAGTTVYVENGSAAMSYFQTNSSGVAGIKIGKDVTPGDVNSDGKVDNADIILLSRYAANWKNIKIDSDAADVNKDAKVDTGDVILLRRYLAGWKNVTLK